MPEWKEEVRKRLEGLNLRPEREAEIVEEVSADLDDRYAALQAQGESEQQALETVLAELDARNLASELRQSEPVYQAPLPEGGTSTGRWLADLLRDFRYAARMLRKNPGFTVVAALTLALGIGANTAVFTIVNTFLLNPLPVKDISGLVTINSSPLKKTAKWNDLQPLSFLNLRDLRQQERSFSSVAGHSSPMSVTLTINHSPHRAFLELVTANYFDTLGIRPFMGRFFLKGEDLVPGASPVAEIGRAHV